MFCGAGCIRAYLCLFWVVLFYFFDHYIQSSGPGATPLDRRLRHLTRAIYQPAGMGSFFGGSPHFPLVVGIVVGCFLSASLRELTDTAKSQCPSSEGPAVGSLSGSKLSTLTRHMVSVGDMHQHVLKHVTGHVADHVSSSLRAAGLPTPVRMTPPSSPPRDRLILVNTMVR